MSTDTIEMTEVLATPQESATATAEVQSETEISESLLSVTTEVANFDRIGAGLAKLATDYPLNVIVDNISTKEGMDHALTAWRSYRNPRLAVEKIRKAVTAPLAALSKQINKKAEGLTATLKAGEDHYKAQITAEEKRAEAIKEQARKDEAERLARHQFGLDTIRGYLTQAKNADPQLTSDRLAAYASAIASMAIVPEEWEEFAVKAVEVRNEVSEALLKLSQEAKAREDAEQARKDEEARLESIRLEQVRQAAELAEQQRKLAEQQAEFAREQEEFRRKQAQAAMPAEVELAAEQQRLQSEETMSLAADIRAGSRRVEWPKNPAYIRKAMGTFESMAPDWENDPREVVRDAISEGRSYLAGLLLEAEQAAADAAAQAKAKASDETCTGCGACDCTKAPEHAKASGQPLAEAEVQAEPVAATTEAPDQPTVATFMQVPQAATAERAAIKLGDVVAMFNLPGLGLTAESLKALGFEHHTSASAKNARLYFADQRVAMFDALIEHITKAKAALA